MTIVLATIIVLLALNAIATTTLIWVIARTAGYKAPVIRIPRLRGPKPRYYA